MAGLEDIVQRVVVDGTGEAGQTLEELGSIGAAAFEAITTAAESTNGAFSLMSGGTLAVIGAVIAVVAAVAKLVDSSAEAVISFETLGDAMGVSAGSAQGLAATFSEVGINFQKFSQMMERGAMRLAQGWENIQDEVESSSSKITGANIAVAESHLAVEEAMQKAEFAADEWKNKLEGDAEAVADAYKKVARESEEAASQVQHDASSVASAQFALEADEAKLREMRSGQKEDPQTKKNREYLQQIQKVEDDKQRIVDAQNKQLNDAQDTADKKRSDALKLSQSLLKQSEDTAKAPLEQQRADLGVDKAKNAVETAVNSLHQTVDKDLQNILSALDGGNLVQALKGGIQNLAKSLELRAGLESKTGTPEVTDTLKVFVDFVRKFGDQMTGAQKDSLGRDMFGGRPDQIARLVEMTKGKSGQDLQDIIEKTAHDITDQQLKTSHGYAEGKADVEHKIATTTHDIALGTGQAAADDVKGAATTVKNVLSEVSSDFDSFKSALKGIVDFMNAPLPPKEERAEGGYISGAGSGTSDSIPARLSNGEFVVRASAVRAYGTDLLHSINDMSARGFALGGYVSNFRPASFGTDGSSGPRPAGSTVNLTIDGNRFAGMHAPADVAAKLTHYAIGRQMAETGRKPSWVS